MNSKFINYISIAIFAFFGGMARAGLNANFSYYGTFWGNVIGCFLLAFFTYFFIETKGLEIRAVPADKPIDVDELLRKNSL